MALAFLIAALGGSIVEGPSVAAASNGYEEWSAYPDGCYYLRTSGGLAGSGRS